MNKQALQQDVKLLVLAYGSKLPAGQQVSLERAITSLVTAAVDKHSGPRLKVTIEDSFESDGHITIWIKDEQAAVESKNLYEVVMKRLNGFLENKDPGIYPRAESFLVSQADVGGVKGARFNCTALKPMFRKRCVELFSRRGSVELSLEEQQAVLELVKESRRQEGLGKKGEASGI